MRSKIIRSLRLRAVLIAACLFSFGAGAQGGPPNPSPVAMLGGNTTLAVTTSTARVAFPVSPTIFPAALVINDGTVEIFFAIGGSSVVATATSAPLLPGKCLALYVGAATNVAAIAATGTSNLRVLQFNGQPGFAC